jgi:hypothetical protein
MTGLRFRRKYFEKRDKKAIEIKKAPDNGKEDSYERNPGRVSQGELPRSGKRGWPGPFVFNLSFQNFLRVLKTCALICQKSIFDK